MAGHTFNVTIDAPREVVFDVLTDHAGYAAITPVRSVELERAGDVDPNGTGAIRDVRVLGRPWPGVREEVVKYERPGRFAYRIISGLPFREHRGTVTFSESTTGTRILYVWEARPSIPLPDALIAACARIVIGVLLRAAAKEAERRSRAVAS